MNELALFAGAGGGILGGVLLGWRTVCAVEFDDYARNVLIQRQNDGCLEPFPIWDDVRTFDGKPWRGLVDVVSGGFPCQDISCAGRGAGIDGARSGLWSEMFRIVCEVGPRFVFVENSPVLTSRGLGRVLGDLASFGYYAEWMVLGADDVGAPHRRKRIWVLAYAKSLRELQPQRIERDQWRRVDHSGEKVAHANGTGLEKWERTPGERTHSSTTRGFWWNSEPHLGGMANGLAPGLDLHGTHSGLDLGRVAKGIPNRVGRLKAIGNGQVPDCAATVFRILLSRIQSTQ